MKIIQGGRCCGKTHRIVVYAMEHGCDIITTTELNKNVIEDTIDRVIRNPAYDYMKSKRVIPKIYVLNPMLSSKELDREIPHKNDYVVDNVDEIPQVFLININIKAVSVFVTKDKEIELETLLRGNW